jgi:hypothetical protein
MRSYETWLRDQLRGEIVEADLVRKHDRMGESSFVFLRATYWRWAETILSVCPDLASAPRILAVGDTHLENFGTWRDADGRLVWGVNDFDEAAVMPWPLDLLRLAASAMLVRNAGSSAAVCTSIWQGYLDGISAPGSVILERDHRWLRDAIMLPEKQRAKWWSKLDQPDETVPERYRVALAAALPDQAASFVAFARTAGTGSLGRPRHVAVADWRGGPVVRECKVILASAWTVFAEGAPGRIRAADIAGAVVRAVDPHYRIAAGLVVRRLSPNSRKVELDDAGDVLVSPEMLRLMGREIACCHAGDGGHLDGVRRDAARRDARWLEEQARQAAQAILQDFATFA